MRTRFYARKCDIVEVDRAVGKEFLKENHLMGNGRGDYLGLEHEGNLVTVLQFRRKNGQEYEISRFCHKLEHTVVGGYTRLINEAVRKFSPTKLITFVDLRYGSGEYLNDLGFTLETCYPSFCWVNVSSLECFARMQFPGNSGYDAKLYKLWDCGQAKYVKCITQSSQLTELEQKPT